MNKSDKTRQQLLDELQEITSRAMEAEETLRAILSGGVDGLVINTDKGERVFTLSGAEHPYRVMIETMNEGAVTLAADGTILYSNRRFADIVKRHLEKITGSSIYQYFPSKNHQLLEALFKRGLKENTKVELGLLTGDRNYVPVLLSVSSLQSIDIPDAVCMVVTDLTEQKRDEEILAEGKLTAQILDQAAEIFVLCDDQGCIVRASQSVNRLFGKSPVFQTFDESFHLCYSDGTPFVLLSALSDNGLHAVEVTFEHGKNNIFSFLLSASALITNKKLTGIVVVMVDVTSRKQAEEKLRESEENYRLVVENAKEAIIIAQDLKVVFANSAAAAMAGYSEKILTPKPFTDLVHPDDRNMVVDYHIRRLKGEEVPLAYSFRIISQDGTVKWVDFNTTVIQWKERPAALSFLNDITARREAEEALRASEEYFKEITENSSDVIIITDKNGDIKYCSRSIERFSGYKPEELIGSSAFTFIHPDDVERARDDYGKAILTTGSAIPNEFRVVRKDGSTRYFGGLGKNLLDNPAVAGFVMNIRDITERKQAEEELSNSERLYRAIGESIDYGIWICDPDGRNIYASESFLRLVGLTQKQCSEFGWGKVLHPDDAKRTISLWKECVRTEGKWDIEHRFRSVDGNWHPILARGVPVRNENGKIIYWAGINLDISRMKQAEEALITIHSELEQRVEQRTGELKTALSEIELMKNQLEAENIYFRQENRIKQQFNHIIGQSDGLKYVLYRAEQVSSSNATVLILGETGVGKELIAFAIHDMSSRKERPLITVNCAALPGNLIESELFGREKGAFTGADIRRMGRFEIADGSSICLDEIGELPLELQGKLLRVIQHNEFERLGSSHTVKVDVRIIATTNRDLEEEIRKGRFRQDLYYRLNVFPITVPPLRQRKDDIPPMVQAFVERYSRKLGKQITSIPKETMTALQDYPWPGNVRELESIVERAVILCSGSVLRLADKLDILSHPILSTVRTLEETERNQILKILSEIHWRIEGKDGAATILGLHPSTLRARMHKLGIVRPETKEPD
ncbi:MAG: PAS domain S-box protein [Smithellaceae bacterium]|jgi:PAS domain S-box-containing protein